jgi:hypothetical protein
VDTSALVALERAGPWDRATPLADETVALPAIV